MPANLENSEQWPHDWKRSVCISIPKNGNAKECSNYCTIALISQLAKWWSKCSKPGFNSMWTMNFQIFQLNLEKAEEPEIKLPLDHRKTERVPLKHLLVLYWLRQSLWLCGLQQTGKFWKRWEYQMTLPASWEICVQVKKQQLELDMEKHFSNRERSTSRLYLVTLLI